MARYQFDYGEIAHCKACPLWHSYIACTLDADHANTPDEMHDYLEYVESAEAGKRPSFCRLTEVNQDG